MRVFAIGDLHLEGGQDKPMSVFGEQWEGHFEKIRTDWLERVGPEDLVLIRGGLTYLGIEKSVDTCAELELRFLVYGVY